MITGRPQGLEKIGRSHYAITGAKCTCGGEMRAQIQGDRGEFLWELYCPSCLTCDVNGYSTLRECVAVARKVGK